MGSKGTVNERQQCIFLNMEIRRSVETHIEREPQRRVRGGYSADPERLRTRRIQHLLSGAGDRGTGPKSV